MRAAAVVVLLSACGQDAASRPPPPAGWKRVELAGVVAGRVLQLDLPEAATVTEVPAEGTQHAHATIVVRDGIELDIRVPQGEMATLDLELHALEDWATEDVKIERQDRDADGYTLIYSVVMGRRRWKTMVARPSLEVGCDAANLADLDEAQLVATICRTLARAR